MDIRDTVTSPLMDIRDTVTSPLMDIRDTVTSPCGKSKCSGDGATSATTGRHKDRAWTGARFVRGTRMEQLGGI
jgi:hypothetical protein